MTDVEINLAIARLEYPDDEAYENGDQCWVEFDFYNETIYPDYCNNWADIGPIIEREGMSIDFWESGHWTVNNSDTPSVSTVAETPTKAAALCYLKMKGVER